MVGPDFYSPKDDNVEDDLENDENRDGYDFRLSLTMG
jgi:hypothetical protein